MKPLPAFAAFLSVLLAFGAAPLARAEGEAAEPLTVELRTQGPDVGEGSKAVLAADGKVTLTAVRRIPPQEEKFEKTLTLSAPVLAALRNELDRLKAFELPPLADPPKPETVAVTIDVKLGARTLHREYAAMHMLRPELVDHRVVHFIELYTGLSYWLSEHLLQAAKTHLDANEPKPALACARRAVEALGLPYPDDEDYYLDHSGDRFQMAKQKEKEGDAAAAVGLYRSVIFKRRICYYGWLRKRGILDAVEKTAEPDPNQ